jgi:hypothetical protein
MAEEFPWPCFRLSVSKAELDLVNLLLSSSKRRLEHDEVERRGRDASEPCSLVDI